MTSQVLGWQSLSSAEEGASKTEPVVTGSTKQPVLREEVDLREGWGSHAERRVFAPDQCRSPAGATLRGRARDYGEDE